MAALHQLGPDYQSPLGTTESSGLLVHKKMRKKRSSLMMGVKDEEDWEGPVRRRKKKRRVGPNCASPKSKLVEYHQVRGYLLLLF